ncbi:MAG TPA: RyR domain-containing protein [Prosthecobacter sp.]|nr:RyR domain-containing protein [Prosthecobacter sp.]
MSAGKHIPLDDTSRRDPGLWPRLSDPDWVALHAPRFTELRPRFESCAAALTAVLNMARKKLAVEAIIQVRAKEVPSFAEKILRKRDGYSKPKPGLPPDPLARLTDLCGGRVICQTSDQVRAVTAWIGEHFEIDWENSDDASGRLRATEFGYRTVNRIVSFKPGVFPAEMVPEALCQPVPLPGSDLRLPLKMEIQIRTLLEHAWADVSHDRAYKTEVKLPAHLVRDLHSKAAILEETDRDIARLLAALEDYHSNYGAHHKRAEVAEEIALQRIVLQQMTRADQRATLAVRIAKLCLAAGDQAGAVEVLAEFAAHDNHDVQRALGQALVEMHQEQPSSAEFGRGLEHLRQASRSRGADAETHCLLGEALLLRDEEDPAAEAYHAAIRLDATEPSSLARYIEHETARQGNVRLILLAEPMIRAAMKRCHTQIQGSVNQPAAWAALALLHLMVNEPNRAVEALAHLAILCEAPPAGDAARQPCAAARHFLRLRRALSRLVCVRDNLDGHAILERAVLLMLAGRAKDAEALRELEKLASRHLPDVFRQTAASGGSVLIVAGGCAPEVEPKVADFEAPFHNAFTGLPLPGRALVLVSGGTRSGISRLAGDLAEKSGGRIKAAGYTPSTPDGCAPDRDTKRYAWLCESAGTDFTALDPLQGWTDLITARVDLKNIKLLAFAPGKIARAEMAVAFALGARVGLVEHPDLPPDRHFDDSCWLEHLGSGSLARMPLDAMTLRAFLLADQIPEADARYEKAARKVHEAYLKSAKPADPSLSPWEDLPPELKVSNYHQVAYWTNILGTEGLGVRPVPAGSEGATFDISAAIGKEGVLRLAEMEHGRWNIERLLLGWRWAEKKDVARKLSPSLIPWDALSPEIQGYDISAIRGLPASLLAAGFEVFKLE